MSTAEDHDFDDVREIGRQRTSEQFARLILISDLVSDKPIETSGILERIVEDLHAFDDYADMEPASRRRKLERDLELLESVSIALNLDLRVDRTRKPHRIWYEGPRRIAIRKDSMGYASGHDLLGTGPSYALTPKSEGSLGAAIREALAKRYPGVSVSAALALVAS